MKKAVLIILCMVARIAVLATDNPAIDRWLEQFDKAQGGAVVTLANQLMRTFNDEQFTDQLVQFQAATPVDSMRQQVWYWAAEWYYDKQQYDLALHYGGKALPLCADGSDIKADCLNLLGMTCVRLGDFKRAADYAQQCLEIDLKSGDHDRISSSMNTVAGIYMAAYQPREAEKYILQALEHADKADNPPRKAVLLGMASEIYHTLGDDNKAVDYAQQAFAIDSALQRPQAYIRLSQKASALLGLHRYGEAENILRRIIPEFERMGDMHTMAIALNRLGMALLCQKRQKEAIPYYKQAAGLFSQMGDLYNEIHSHRGLYESYWKLNPDSAKYYLDRFDLLKDSLYSHASADALSRYNAEFGNDQLKQENESLSVANRRNIIIGLALIVCLLLAAWLVIMHLRRRSRRQMQGLIREIEQLRANKPTQAEAEPEAPQQGTEPETDNAEVQSADDRVFLMRVIEAVYDGMPRGEFSVETIASQVNMSVSTFRRRLLAVTGKSPKAYIQAIQMERAIQLLDDPNQPVAQIAQLCGFSETSNFSHTFKRVYGCTPTQYRDGINN
ncbi:MAG: tetratricopeptide repeat protein [Muribaculaceae bacterium]|nr:tetratricopeptide repeat protein [Muribaculaceae bacterium]